MPGNFSEALIIQQFTDFINSSQFRPKSNLTINADGNIHRYTLANEKSGGKSGAYCLHIDGYRPAGWAMDWHNTASKITWKYEYTDEERREYGREMNNSESQAKYEAERKEHERRKAEKERSSNERKQQALRMALAEFQHAHLTYSHLHPYLKSRFVDLGIFIPNTDLYIKCVVDAYKGGICKQGELLVPMFNVITGKFQSLIHVPVTPDKERGFMKYIYKDTSIIGAAHWFVPEHSSEADTVLACEGITTALACVVLTGGKTPVFSTGTCNNLFSVCEALTKRYPNKRICVMADDDKTTEHKTGHNPGIEAAEKCVSAGVAHYFKAPPGNHSVNYDWYDFLKEVIQNKKEGNNL